MTAYETIALVRKSPMEPIMRMALVGRHERLDARPGPRARDPLRGRPTAAALRPRAQELAETIAQHDPEHLATVKRALWAALEGSLGAMP